MARAVDVPLTIDDFQTVSNRTPLLADFKPSGQYVMEDLQPVGGIPAVIKMLLEAGLLDGGCMTVTGKTLAENVKDLPGLKPGQQIVQPLSQPIKPTGHLQILKGNLAPKARSPRSPARRACDSPVRRRYTTRKKTCCTPSSARRSRRAT